MKNNTTRTRLLSVLLAVLFAMTALGAFPVFAAPGNLQPGPTPGPVDPVKNQVKLKAPLGEDLGGMEVYAYQILTESVDTLTGAKVYTVTTNFQPFFNQDVKTAAEGSYSYLVEESESLTSIYITYDEDTGKLIYSDEEPEDETFIKVAPGFDEDYFEASLLDKLNGKADEIKILSGWLRDYVRNFGDGFNKSEKFYKKVVAGEGNNYVMLDDLNDGYWFLLSEKAPTGVANVETVLKTTDGKIYSVNLKAEYPKFEKTVNGEESVNANSGDVLSYQLKYAIQNMSEYTKVDAEKKSVFTLKITDTMANQMLLGLADGKYVNANGTEFGKGVFTVKFTGTVKNGDETEKKTVTYEDLASVADPNRTLKSILEIPDSTYGSYADGEQKFVLDFDVAKLAALWAEIGFGDDVIMTVDYKAELTDDAVRVNGNEAKIEYSNDPSNENNTVSDDDETTVYTYGVVIEKEFSDETTDKFGEVEFELYEATAKEADTETDAPATPNLDINKDVEEGDIIGFTGEDGNYYRATTDGVEVEPITTLKLDANGKLKIYGLAPGYYVLKESKVPEGYSSGGDIVIYITEDGDARLVISGDEDFSYAVYKNTDTFLNGSLLYEDEEGNETTKEDGVKDYLDIKVLNQKGDWEFPGTGGMGTLLFGIGGVLLIAVAAFIFFAQKKREEA